MKNVLFNKFFLLLFLSLLLPFSCENNNYKNEDLNIINLNLKQISSSKYNKNETKFELINFWASWCQPCINEVEILNIINKKNAKVSIIGISIMDDIESAKKFLIDNNVTYNNYFDEDLSSLKLFNQINSIPVTFLVNEKKEILIRIDGELTKQDIIKIEDLIK
tara:strand:+ start:1558 stop:2049 length:492 start_codon:yes stop_codon:yes gene_type:complete